MNQRSNPLGTAEGRVRASIVAECGLSRDEQRSARKALKENGLISERYDRLGHQLYFQVNMEAYNAVIQRLYDVIEGDDGGPKPWKINPQSPGFSGRECQPLADILQT